MRQEGRSGTQSRRRTPPWQGWARTRGTQWSRTWGRPLAGSGEGLEVGPAAAGSEILPGPWVSLGHSLVRLSAKSQLACGCPASNRKILRASVGVVVSHWVCGHCHISCKKWLQCIMGCFVVDAVSQEHDKIPLSDSYLLCLSIPACCPPAF